MQFNGLTFSFLENKELTKALSQIWPELEAVRPLINDPLIDENLSTAIKREGIYLPERAIPMDMKDWLGDLMERRPQMSDKEVLQSVNDYINNRVKPVSDQQTYGLLDYISSPQITLDRGQGDCEDIAILKASILKKLGFKDEQLVFVQGFFPEKFAPGTSLNERGHLTLIVHSPEGVFLLDNNLRSVDANPREALETMDGCFDSGIQYTCLVKSSPNPSTAR